MSLENDTVLNYITEDQLAKIKNDYPSADDFLKAGFECGIFNDNGSRDDEFINRLTSSVEQQYRSAMAECIACWFLKYICGVDVKANRTGQCSADLYITFEDGIYVEVKHPGIKQTLENIKHLRKHGSLPKKCWRDIMGDFGMELVSREVERSYHQLHPKKPNVLLLVPTFAMSGGRERVKYQLTLGLLGRIKSQHNNSGYKKIKNELFMNRELESEEDSDSEVPFPKLSAVGIIATNNDKWELVMMHNPSADYRLNAGFFKNSIEFIWNSNGIGRWSDECPPAR